MKYKGEGEEISREALQLDTYLISTGHYHHLRQPPTLQQDAIDYKARESLETSKVGNKGQTLHLSSTDALRNSRKNNRMSSKWVLTPHIAIPAAVRRTDSLYQGTKHCSKRSLTTLPAPKCPCKVQARRPVGGEGWRQRESREESTTSAR